MSGYDWADEEATNGRTEAADAGHRRKEPAAGPHPTTGATPRSGGASWSTVLLAAVLGFLAGGHGCDLPVVPDVIDNVRPTPTIESARVFIVHRAGDDAGRELIAVTESMEFRRHLESIGCDMVVRDRSDAGPAGAEADRVGMPAAVIGDKASQQIVGAMRLTDDKMDLVRYLATLGIE